MRVTEVALNVAGLRIDARAPVVVAGRTECRRLFEKIVYVARTSRFVVVGGKQVAAASERWCDRENQADDEIA